MQWLLILLIISLPLGHLTRFEAGNGVALYPQDLLAGVMLLWAAVRRLRGRRIKPELLQPILIFTAACLLSLIFAAASHTLLQLAVGKLYLLRWLVYAGIYFFALDFRSSGKEIIIFNRQYGIREALLLSGLALTVFGLAQYLLVPDLTQLKWLGWDDHFYRLVGTLLDPGFTGVMLILTLFLGLEVKLGKLVKFLAVGLPLVALPLTYSRASYLALFATGSVYLLAKKKAKIALGAGAIFLLALLLLPRPGGEGVNLTRLYSITSRLESWSNALVIAYDHPLFGVGFNLLRYAQKDYGWLDEDWQTSHGGAGIENSYLFVLATTGIVGLAVYLNLLVRMFMLGKRALGRGKIPRPAILASLTAVSVSALFNNTWFYPWIMAWIWLLLAEEEGGKLLKA
jgi:O-antigen ligase